jgi:ACS family hexuronate transporter-like MFS transporter
MTQQVGNTPETSQNTRQNAWPLAIVATLGMSVSYVDRQTLAAIAPSVTSALGIDNTHFGWLLSAFSVAYLIGAPLAGVLVDRLGARRGFALAVLVWSLIAGLHAFAFSFFALLVLRVGLAAAESPSFPSAAQAIRRAFPGAKRPLAVGILFTGSSIGSVIAGELAVRLDAHFGFRAAFVIVAVLGTIWIPAWLLVSRGFGLDRGAAIVTTHSDASWWDVVRTPAVLRSVVAIVGSAPAMMFVLNWVSKYLVDGWHLKKGEIGHYLVVAPFLFDVGAIGFGYVASRRTSKRTHRDLIALSMVLQTTLVLAPLAPSPETAIAICAISAMGGGGIYALVTNDVLSRVPIERTSAVGGAQAAAQSLSHIIGAPLVGFAVDRTHSFDAALFGLGIVIPPTILAFLFWPGVEREEA